MKFFYNTMFISSIIGLCSCNAYMPDNIPKKQNIELKTKRDLKITINTLSFKSKANPDSMLRVRSFEAFLTSNYSDPFAVGSKPYGENIRFHADVINGSANIVFPNVPSGGPYFAVIAAFDKINGAVNRANITRSNNTIISNDKKWARSSNSFTYTNSILSFSDNSNALKVSLKLIPFVTIDTTINITDGQPMPNTIGLTN